MEERTNKARNYALAITAGIILTTASYVWIPVLFAYLLGFRL